VDKRKCGAVHEGNDKGALKAVRQSSRLTLSITGPGLQGQGT
jgi:hypothetical protein